jgi:protein TonB
VLHAVLLAIRFHPFDLSKVQDRTSALEVALVNAKSKSKPTKADILAQANLDGGGNTDADRKAKAAACAAEGRHQRRGRGATRRIEALEIEAKS